MRPVGRDQARLKGHRGHIPDVNHHVYVHVPFCARRCSYCDFSIAVRRTVPTAEYLDALRGELEARFGNNRPVTADTIYLGGGTPSRLGGQGVADTIALVGRYFPPAGEAEITIEANPEDVTDEASQHWAAAGVNRVSLGTQSFDEGALRWMHRLHDADAAERAVVRLRSAGITNLSLDLIFALPSSLRRNFEVDVGRLLLLKPQHVSLYGLTVEAQTPLARWVERGITIERAEEGYEDDFLLAHRLLEEGGFEHYEVSNYARAGQRARHNSAYWSGVPYLGLGPAAHGFDGNVRRWNARHYAAWRDRAMQGADPLEGSETLTHDNRTSEQVYLGLRSDAGLVLRPDEHELVAPWVTSGWAWIGSDGRLRCTALGWLRLDALAAALTHHRSR